MKTNYKNLYKMMQKAYTECYYRFDGYKQATELFVKKGRK